MRCEHAGPLFPGFCLGVIEDHDRAALEAHLCECRECVAELLAVKRAIDLAEDVPAPRPEVRARLRRAVAVELGLVAAPRSRWERPAALAFAAVAVIAATGAMRWLTSGPGAPPYALAAHDDGGARR